MTGVGLVELLVLAALVVVLVLGVMSARDRRKPLDLEASMGWPAWTSPQPPRILTRVYAGRGEAAALQAAAEGRLLAAYGYVPVSQSVSGATWRTSEWLGCVVLTFFFGLGLLLFLMYAFVEPASSLMVAYERRFEMTPG